MHLIGITIDADFGRLAEFYTAELLFIHVNRQLHFVEIGNAHDVRADRHEFACFNCLERNDPLGRCKDVTIAEFFSELICLRNCLVAFGAGNINFTLARTTKELLILLLRSNVAHVHLIVLLLRDCLCGKQFFHPFVIRLGGFERRLGLHHVFFARAFEHEAILGIGCCGVRFCRAQLNAIVRVVNDNKCIAFLHASAFINSHTCYFACDFRSDGDIRPFDRTRCFD